MNERRSNGLPAYWYINREAAPDIAELLIAKGVDGVAEAIYKALERPPGIRAFIQDSPAISVWLSAEEAAQVWQLYENGREIASASLDG